MTVHLQKSSRGNGASWVRLLRDPFPRLAESSLATIHDPKVLATRAEKLTGRTPEAAFLRARLWGRVLTLVAPQGFLNGARATFSQVCAAANISVTEAKNTARVGVVLNALVDQGVDIENLRRASSELFRLAARQRSRARRYLTFAARVLASDGQMSTRAIHEAWVSKHGSISGNLDVVKPSDWWAFSRPKWRRDPKFPGSIPGEVYANALYFFAPRSGVAVDPMAGSGMLARVYRDRHLWQRDTAFRLRIVLYDIAPLRRSIGRHDARRPLPMKADWVFLDPPYFGQSKHLYSATGGLADAESYSEYLRELEQVIAAMARSLNKGGRLCLLLPKWSGKSPADHNLNMPGDALLLAQKHKLTWMDTAFVSRGRQQEAGFGFQNAAAKRKRRMLSDTCVLNVFRK